MPMIGDMATLVRHSTASVVWSLVAGMLFLLLLSSQPAQAKITKLLKKRKIVVINDKRVKKGDQVCFYKKKAKRACGRVVKVSKSKKKSYVRIKKRASFRKLEKGMTHEVVGAGGSVASKSSGSSPFKVSVAFQPSFNRRAKYTLLHLDEENKKFIEAKPNEGKEFFEQAHDFFAQQAWAGVGLEFDAIVYNYMSVAFGVRYVNLATATALHVPGTQLDGDNPDAATGVKASEHELSGWLDFYPYEVPTAKIRLGVGLEGNYSMLSLAGMIYNCKNNACASTVPATGKEYYKFKNNLITMSARFTARRNFAITEQFGVGTAVRGLYTPNFLEVASPTLTTDDKNFIAMFEGKEKLQEALEKELNHRSALWSVMLELSAFFSF